MPETPTYNEQPRPVADMSPAEREELVQRALRDGPQGADQQKEHAKLELDITTAQANIDQLHVSSRAQLDDLARESKADAQQQNAQSARAESVLDSMAPGISAELQETRVQEGAAVVLPHLQGLLPEGANAQGIAELIAVSLRSGALAGDSTGAEAGTDGIDTQSLGIGTGYLQARIMLEVSGLNTETLPWAAIAASLGIDTAAITQANNSSISTAMLAAARRSRAWPENLPSALQDVLEDKLPRPVVARMRAQTAQMLYDMRKHMAS